MVTPSLRGVAVSCRDQAVGARFIYERSECEHVELVAEIETELLADFDEDLATEFIIEAVPASTSRVPGDGEVWVYLRREG